MLRSKLFYRRLTIKGFLRLVEEKNKKPYDPDAPNFDTQAEVDEAKILIEKNKEEIRQKYS
jgi:hypothetical protein